MTSLNILIVIDEFETNYPRDQNYIIRYMLEKGNDVTVLTTKNTRFELYDRIFFPRASIVRAPTLIKIKKAKIFFGLDTFKALLCKYDVAHAFTFFTFSSILNALTRAQIKVIRSEIGPPNALNFRKALHIEPYRSLIYIYKSMYSYFTVYNIIERQSLKLLGFPDEYIVILPPMIDFYKYSSLTRAKYTDDTINIGVIARISPEKGIHRLIPIMKKLVVRIPNFYKKIKLLLAGRIDNYNYARRVLRELKRILGRSFVYMGEVALPYEFYRSVDIILIPSLTETGAITCLEAMAARKVVIASNIYPINLYIINGKNGFLFNMVSKATEVLVEIINESIDMQRVLNNASRYAMKHDYRYVCQKLERVYKYAT